MGRLRYRLALRRPYRYRYRRWVRVDVVAEACRGLGWVGLALVRAREGMMRAVLESIAVAD